MSSIYGKIKNGQVIIHRFHRDDLPKYEGKFVEIKIDGESKTIQQLRYLWGVVYKIVSDFTGFTTEEVAEIYKKKFLTYHKEYKGQTYLLTKGLSGLKKDEMAEFITKVIQHAGAELGLLIPSPDDEFEYS